MVRFSFASPGKKSRKQKLEEAQKEADEQKSRRRNFGFLRTGDKRMSTSTLQRTRDHAKQLAAMVPMEPLDTPTSVSSGQGLLSLKEDSSFDPFQNDNINSSNNSGNKSSYKSKKASKPKQPASNNNGDFADFAAFDGNFSPASPPTTSTTMDTFETSSFGSAFDNSWSASSVPLPPSNRKPQNPSLDQFVQKTRSPMQTSGSLSGISFDKSRGDRSVISMPALKSSNASRQPPSATSSRDSAAVGAAARQRMRNHGKNSSNQSAASFADDNSSIASSAPGSPAFTTNKNQLPRFQRTNSFSNASVASYASNNSSIFVDGGFTFDAFGLDQSQVAREVNEAMQDLAGQGMPGFSVFFNGDSDGDFESQAWDSPANSRRSSPAPSDSEADGYVDGFRVTRSQSTPQYANASPGGSIDRSFSSPASRKPVRSQSSRAAHTPPRWENHSPATRSMRSKNSFRPQAASTSNNLFQEDPWGSDSGTESDFGGARSEILNTFQTETRSAANRYVDTKSDIGVSSQFTGFPPLPPVQPTPKHYHDDSSSDSDASEAMKEELAAEFAQEFVRRISPRHSNSPQAASPTVKSYRASQLQKQQHYQQQHDFDGFAMPQDQLLRQGSASTEQYTPKSQAASRFSSFRSKYESSKSVSQEAEGTPRTSSLRNSYATARTGGLGHSPQPAFGGAGRGNVRTEEKKDDEDSTPVTKPSRLNTNWEKWEEKTARNMLSPASGILRARDADSVSQQRFDSLRQRLKPSANNDDRARTEVGASYRSSVVSNVADRLRRESKSPEGGRLSDTKSDTEANPSLANVTLRKSAAAKMLERQSNSTTYEFSSHQSPTSPRSFRERQAQSYGQVQVQPQHQSQAAKVAERKLTYRERREMELQREREEKERLEATKAKEEPKTDVAAMIRRRIAANKQKATAPTPAQVEAPQVTDFRSNLRSVSSTESSPRHRQQSPRPLRTWSSEEHDPTNRSENNDMEGADDMEGRLTAQSLNVVQHERLSDSPEPSGAGFSTAAAASDVESFLSRRQDASAPPPAKKVPSEAANNLESLLSHKLGAPTPSATEKSNADTANKLESLLSNKFGAPKPPSDERAAAANKLEGLLSNKFGAPKPASDERAAAANKLEGLLSNKFGAPKPPPDEKAATANKLESLLSSKFGGPPAAKKPTSAAANNLEAMLSKRIGGPPSAPDADDGGQKDVKSMLNGLLGARIGPPGVGRAPTAPAPTAPESTDSGTAASGRPALKDDPKYERYFRMLKVGMPMEVVKHAMQKDGFDPSIMDGDHSKPVGLPLKDDPKYTKYFKMLKMGISMPQVKHAMERDGLNPDVMDQDHNLPAASCEKRSVSEPKQKDTHRRARLHWKTLARITKNSLWSKIEKEPEGTEVDFDEDEFKELFQAELTPSKKPQKGTSSSKKKGAAVRVIDAKRANNGGIILARVKMSHDEMADTVDRIDGDALSAEQIENIIEYLPTKEERAQLEKYMLEKGEDAASKFDGLCECEKFMVSMMTVKYAKRKVRALLFKLQFVSCLQSIADDAEIIEDACDQLKNSTRLRQLLGIVLQFGNRLNTAGKKTKNKAKAISLESLLKLSQAKAFDKKTTFLHYVVMIVHRNNELLLKFTDDIPTVMKADKVYWDQCLQDLDEVENQLENVRRISLHEARAKKQLGLRNKKSNNDDDDESLGDIQLSLEEEVEALRATKTGLFTLTAIKQVSALRDKVEKTRKKFVRVLEYFGEDEDSMQPHELFNIFCKFGRDFNKAREEAFAKMKKKLREERKKAGNGTPHKGRPPSQPSMSKVISDLKKSAAELDKARPKPAKKWKSNLVEGVKANVSPGPLRTPVRNSMDSSVKNSPWMKADSSNHHTPMEGRDIGGVSQRYSSTPTPVKLQNVFEKKFGDGKKAPSQAHVIESRLQGQLSPAIAESPRHYAPRNSNESQLSAAERLRQKAHSRREQQIQSMSGRMTPTAGNSASPRVSAHVATPESRSPRNSPYELGQNGQHGTLPTQSASPSPLARAARHKRIQAMRRPSPLRHQSPTRGPTQDELSPTQGEF